MLIARALKYRYSKASDLHFPDIVCERGKHKLIIGQSGCGKTTLLHLLGGLRSPYSGEVILDDTRMKDLSSNEMDVFRGQHIGIVFQQSYFVRSLSVLENIVLAQYLAGRNTDRQGAHSLLDRLGIGHKSESAPYQLSHGEQQRAAIARAIVNRPSLILADEPTSALDDKNTDEVVKLLIDQANSVNASLLVVTHDQRLKDFFPEKIVL